MNESRPYAENESDWANNLKSRSIWMRLVFMLIMTFLYSISRIVVGTVVVVQFIWVLFTGKTNPKLLSFGNSLAVYTREIILYLTFNTEKRPFPFDLEWPD